MYYGKVRIKFDIERCYCPSIHAIKATVIWEPENHCRIFDVGRSHARKIKFQKRYYIEKLENNETNSGHKHNAHMYSSRFQNHFMSNPHSLVSRFSQNHFLNVMKIAHTTPHIFKTSLYNKKKVLILFREHRNPTLIIHTLQSRTHHIF